FKKLLRFLQIAHKYGLISGPPITPLKRQASFKFLFKISNELEQRHGIAWPAADIEGLTAYCLATIESRFVSADQILNVKHVARLFAVTENGNRLPKNRRNCEPGDPALVLDAKLPRPIDAALSKRRTVETVDAGVVDYVLVGGALGTSV